MSDELRSKQADSFQHWMDLDVEAITKYEEVYKLP